MTGPLDASLVAKARVFLTSLPSVEPGLIDHVSLHWSATSYGWARESAAAGSPLPYNVVADVDSDGDIALIAGMDPRKNARKIDPDEVMNVTYCASCWRRNSHGVAASIAAQENATPADFGQYPLTKHLVEAMCAGAGALCAKYSIDAASRAACFTHAEAAVWDGYFLGESTRDGVTRWDLSTLEPHPEMSVEQLKAQVTEVGDTLRQRIREYKLALVRFSRVGGPPNGNQVD